MSNCTHERTVVIGGKLEIKHAVCFDCGVWYVKDDTDDSDVVDVDQLNLMQKLLNEKR